MPSETNRPELVNLAGQYIRDTVLNARKISVTEAAKVLGIGRPALSNFLNGKAAASADMAARIERAFGIPAQTILDLQAARDAAQAKANGAQVSTALYVPPFLDIKANEIEAWAAAIAARSRFAVFIRTLVNSTGVGLVQVDFPGNDDAERPGWDGSVSADEGTPWIPAGQSRWELGTNEDPQKKAAADYKGRTEHIEKTERENTILIFVTPRRWKDKDKWIAARQAERKWKDVSVYDSSDLEQWLAQSVAGQTWFAAETKRGFGAANSLDACWSDWANVSDPPLATELFKTSVESARNTIAAYLSQPPEQPFVVAADSTGEGLAFLSQLFSANAQDSSGSRTRDRVVVFREAGLLPKLAGGASNFIAVVTTRETERELAPYCRTIHSIAVCPRNATNATPDIVLEPLGWEAFEAGLQAMQMDRDQIDRLTRASGRSLTVLRRTLSKVDAIRTPEWARKTEHAERLVPFLLAGAWNSSSSADQSILELLGGKTHEALDKDLQALTQLDDAPVWSVGTYRGVISKIDLLFAIKAAITKADLDHYFDVARLVLSERDPSLDLPEKDQWAAGIYGKTREITPALRDGIRETLVLFAVHGDELFQARLGVNLQAKADRFVTELLTPLTTRQLEEHDQDLPTYAEAAPDAFLKLLEDDLNSDTPASFGLMRPVDSGVFAKCMRSELLWALEGLCWSPVTLPRAARILAKLSQIKIEDNWVNKPTSSLESLFRAWMPQTAASLEQRIALMHQLAEEFPDVAWRICMDQFGECQQVGHHSHKPRWRNDGQGHGQPLRNDEPYRFAVAMVSLALNWKHHTRDTIADLVQRLHALAEKDQGTVWELVGNWAKTAVDADRAWMRETIRVKVMSRRAARMRGDDNNSALATAASAAYDVLEPTDTLNKNEWLFRQQWVDESADELQDDDFDFGKHEERVNKKRTEALKAIYEERGVEGVFSLAEMGKAAGVIGYLMATILPQQDIAGFIGAAMPEQMGATWARKNIVHGAVRAVEKGDARASVLAELKKLWSEKHFAEVLQLAPFDGSTWSLIDKLSLEAKEHYWSNVVPSWDRQSDEDLNEAVRLLLQWKRPRAAFACVNFVLARISPKLVFQLLKNIAIGSHEQPGEYPLDGYRVTEAFQLLDKSHEFSSEELGSIEFPFIDALTQNVGHREARGVPNLEKYLEANPAAFVQAVVWTYKRSDGEQDPPELMAKDPEERSNRAVSGYKLLNSLKRIPGSDALGEKEKRDKLLAWLGEVRNSCKSLGRLDACDLCLGKMFSTVNPGDDGVWPSEPNRHVLEQIKSRKISDGIRVGLYNARGAHWRAEGGTQERAIAEKYRKWASALEITHPFIASTIHRELEASYEAEAKQHDTEAGIQRRLR